MSTGFFVPNRVSNDFVANQRTAQGAFRWDQAVGEVGLTQQAALQTLNKEYSNTINNAYTSYLMANRGIRGSSMGQGYKEAYIQNTQENLNQQLAEMNMNTQQARYQLGLQGTEALTEINKQYETEVFNLNRVASSAQGYLDYLKSLMSMQDAEKSYAGKDMNLDESYDFVFNAAPQNFRDVQGEPGIGYIDWVRSQMKDNAIDSAWYQWFDAGGLRQFREMTKKGVKPL